MIGYLSKLDWGLLLPAQDFHSSPKETFFLYEAIRSLESLFDQDCTDKIDICSLLCDIDFHGALFI